MEIKNIFESSSVYPESGSDIVYISKNGKVASLKLRSNWEWYVEKYAIAKWCYRDLLVELVNECD